MSAILFKANPVTAKTKIIKNQNVTHRFASNKITVKSLQTSSSPGVIFGIFTLAAGKVYEYAVEGRMLNGSAYLWGDQALNQNIRITAISPASTVYLRNTQSTVSCMIGGFPTSVKVRIGILFDNPTSNSEFTISAISVRQADSVKIANWTLHTAGTHLVVNSKDTTGSWNPIAAFSNTG